jgi:hypothetical protein
MSKLPRTTESESGWCLASRLAVATVAIASIAIAFVGVAAVPVAGA